MAGQLPARADAAVIQTAENGRSPETGTALANYSDTISCERTAPARSQPGTWGGARNRADRTSDRLSDAQVAGLLDAARFALDTGRTFQRHWTVHYGKAGIGGREGARFVSRLLGMAAKQARREGGALTALWVRERASDKGEHVHILLHLPAAMRLHGRTRRWIVAAGGKWLAGGSRVRIIGGRLSKIEGNREAHHRANATNVARYLLKAASEETGERLELTRAGRGGRIVGKRCGWTQNIGRAARDRSF